jgi:acyl-CoA thioesterase I
MRSMRKNVVLASCAVLGLLNSFMWAQAQAPEPKADFPAVVTVGVVPDPCGALEPMPADVAAFLTVVAQARAAKEAPPSPAAGALEHFQAWQSRQLLQDFSQQCRYAMANQALPPVTPHRVVLMGDSITELWGQMDPTFFSGDILDRGISGQTTDQMLGRFRSDVLELKPQVVQILAGTNDIAGNTGPTSLRRIENNIESMVELAKAHHILVVLGSVPPAARFGWRPSIAPIESIQAINVWMKDYAKKAGVVYVDFYSALTNQDHSFRAELSPDGVHPNAAGYAIMRPLSERGIAEARAQHH